MFNQERLERWFAYITFIGAVAGSWYYVGSKVGYDKATWGLVLGAKISIVAYLVGTGIGLALNYYENRKYQKIRGLV